MYYKIFSEIRFPAAVDFFDIKGRILKAYWPGEFVHFQIDDNASTIRFHNSENAVPAGLFLSNDVLSTSFKNLVFSVEGPPTDHYFIDKYKKHLKQFAKILDLGNLSRLGLRAIFCVDELEFKEIVTKVNNGHIFQVEMLRAIGANFSIEDFLVVFQQAESRIQMGPMKKSQQHPNLMSNFAFIDKVPDEFLFIDIDVSTKNIQFKKIDSNIQLLSDRLWKILGAFKAELLETKEESSL